MKNAPTAPAARLLFAFGCPAVSLSEAFEDGLALLRVAEQRGLEGVVSKLRDAPYRSGECRDWRKVKTRAWRDANWAVIREGKVAETVGNWAGIAAAVNLTA